MVGLGYVGLPLAIQFARANVTVIGLDIDAAKVDSVIKPTRSIRIGSAKDLWNGTARRLKILILCLSQPTTIA